LNEPLISNRVVSEIEVTDIISKINTQLLSKNNSIYFLDMKNNSTEKLDASIIQCHFGTDKDRIKATKRALEFMLKSNPLPKEWIFVECQENKKDAKFSYLAKKGIKYIFKKATKRSRGIFLKCALWNIGAHKAKCNNLAFIDADFMFCKSDWLNSVYDAF